MILKVEVVALIKYGFVWFFSVLGSDAMMTTFLSFGGLGS